MAKWVAGASMNEKNDGIGRILAPDMDAAGEAVDLFGEPLIDDQSERTSRIWRT